MYSHITTSPQYYFLFSVVPTTQAPSDESTDEDISRSGTSGGVTAKAGLTLFGLLGVSLLMLL